MHDLLRRGRIRHVVDLEAAVVIAALGVGLDLGEVVLGYAEPLGQLCNSWLARKFLCQRLARTWQLVGAAANRAHVTLMIDDHDVAHDARLVAVRLPIGEHHLRHDSRVAGIGDVEDRSTKETLAWQMPYIGVLTRNADLSGARQIEMTQAAD